MKHKPFTYHKEDGLFWFRIFGLGICAKDTTKHSMNFSERWGYAKTVQIGGWIVRTIKPLGDK